MKRRAAIKRAVAANVPQGLIGEVRQARQSPGVKTGPAINQTKVAGVSSNSQAGLGGQLSRRVTSGAVSQGQAEKVAGQRALLKRAYGSDWRSKVYGDTGYVQRVRSNIAAGKNTGQNEALLTSLMKQRKTSIKRAKAKLS